MTDLTYKVILKDPGHYQFTMPDNFQSNVQVYLWGAGGGKGRGGISGGQGGYAFSNLAINSGDTITVAVGRPGTNGGYPTGGVGGKGLKDGRFSGGSAGTAWDEDADSGAGGGGGAASALLINNVAKCVAAGGGGASGYGDDIGGGYVGYNGGTYVSGATAYYPVTLSWAWCQFMNDYAIWGSLPTTFTLNFPTTGTYTFNFSVDNYGSISLDGTPLITRAGEHNYESVYTATATVSSGDHTITIAAGNLGGPAGVAAQILKPDTSELWNTRALTVSDGLTDNTIGGVSANGGASGGGGGGGYLGGEAGGTFGDDPPSNPPPGNGGQNYGDFTESGVTGTLSSTSKSLLKVSPGAGLSGTAGYAVLVFTKKITIYNKDSGNWTPVKQIYHKSNDGVLSYTPTTKAFSTVGTQTWTVPVDVFSINISYPTPTGIETKTMPVVPGENLTVTVGDFGGISSVTSSNSTLNIPAFDTTVFSYAGNVDHIIAQDVQVATTFKTSYSGAGTNSTLEAGALAAGITYTVTTESYHGDLYATINITPVTIDVCLGELKVYTSSGSGRQYPSAHTYQQQPTAGNGYIMNDYQGDYYSGEGYFTWNTNLQQRGYVTLAWRQPVMNTGWIPVDQVWYKNGGVWTPIMGNKTITPDRIE